MLPYRSLLPYPNTVKRPYYRVRKTILLKGSFAEIFAREFLKTISTERWW
jgi:hypothetical protein